MKKTTINPPEDRYQIIISRTNKILQKFVYENNANHFKSYWEKMTFEKCEVEKI